MGADLVGVHLMSAGAAFDRLTTTWHDLTYIDLYRLLGVHRACARRIRMACGDVLALAFKSPWTM